MKEISKLTKKELKKEYEAISQQIGDIGCYGVRDLQYRELLEREIDKRHMTIHTKTTVR